MSVRQKSSLPSRLPYARHRLHVPPPESAPYPPDERSRSPPKPELDRLCLPLSLIDIVLDADAVIQPQPGPRGSGSANKKDSDSVMSRTFDVFYSAIMTTEGRDGAVERELSNHQREIIDTCFEEGQFESAIALMEQLRTSNAKLAVSHPEHPPAVKEIASGCAVIAEQGGFEEGDSIRSCGPRCPEAPELVCYYKSPGNDCSSSSVL
ncbi:hypothetical protein D9615_004882 [Tricholomella constricta]|uniref:Uncharacterized protein n=1 Tax=Tricholomella constricta TaxID=117010 RepID=A0A8H5HGL4_9AGAR|nr:hypothetical protein D9615_004882 [Tricholomella constricta]